MIIKIDIREQELIVQLQRLIALNDIFKNINVEKVNLPIGDIIIFDPVKNEDVIIIERKTISDLLASIKDGRYEEQSYRLNGTNTHNHNIIYLLEGAIIKYNPKFRSTLYSSLFSLNYYKGFSVINVLNQTETGDILMAFASKLLRENKPGFYSDLSNNNENNNTNYISTLKTSKKSHINSDNIFQLMLMQIPGISNVSALALAEEFKNMENLLNALKSTNVDKLENIKLASGRKLSKKIIASLKENLV